MAARPAATVVLLRDAANGIEVYVHRRHPQMAFAGGMLAFPGGQVDPIDLIEPADLTGADGGLPAWTSRLDPDPASARGYVRAAIRELREETGVELEASQLLPWARWVTPRYHDRRYDTWFFLAALPPGQQPRDLSGEADHVAWIRPADALDRTRRGDLIAMIPTSAVLSELANYARTADALAAADGRNVNPVVAGWIDNGDAVVTVLPGEAGYPGDDPGDVGDDRGERAEA